MKHLDGDGCQLDGTCYPNLSHLQVQEHSTSAPSSATSSNPPYQIVATDYAFHHASQSKPMNMNPMWHAHVHQLKHIASHFSFISHSPQLHQSNSEPLITSPPELGSVVSRRPRNGFSGCIHGSCLSWCV